MTRRHAPPREIAASLALEFHTRMVELSTGGAEGARAAYEWAWPWLRSIAQSDVRVSRKRLRRVMLQCLTQSEAIRAHWKGYHLGDFADEVQAIAQAQHEYARALDVIAARVESEAGPFHGPRGE